MKAASSAMTQTPRDRVPSGRMLALADPRRPDREKPTKQILMIPFLENTDMIYMHWVPTGQTINKKYYVEGIQEEIHWEEARTLRIGSVGFPPGQCTSPQLHPCH